MPNQKTFSSGEAIRFGWKAFQENMGVFIIVAIIAVVGGMVPIAGTILSILLHLGAVTVGLKFVSGAQKITIEDWFLNYRLFFHFLLSSVLVGIVSAIGFVLFIIPGIIAGIGLEFYGYAIVDRKAGPIEALKQSWELTKGVRWELFVFGLLLIGLNIVGALALGIGLIATIPTSFIAVAFVYNKLRLQTDGVPMPTTPQPISA